MFKLFCDGCGTECKPNKAGARRFEEIISEKDGPKLGVLLTPLVNNDVSPQNHICDSCIARMLLQTAKTFTGTNSIKELNEKILAANEYLKIKVRLENQLDTNARKEQEAGDKFAEANAYLSSVKQQLADNIKQIETLKNKLAESTKQELFTKADLSKTLGHLSALKEQLAQADTANYNRLQKELAQQIASAQEKSAIDTKALIAANQFVAEAKKELSAAKAQLISSEENNAKLSLLLDKQTSSALSEKKILEDKLQAVEQRFREEAEQMVRSTAEATFNLKKEFADKLAVVEKKEQIADVKMKEAALIVTSVKEEMSADKNQIAVLATQIQTLKRNSSEELRRSEAAAKQAGIDRNESPEYISRVQRRERIRAAT